MFLHLAELRLHRFHMAIRESHVAPAAVPLGQFVVRPLPAACPSPVEVVNFRILHLINHPLIHKHDFTCRIVNRSELELRLPRESSTVLVPTNRRHAMMKNPCSVQESDTSWAVEGITEGIPLPVLNIIRKRAEFTPEVQQGPVGWTGEQIRVELLNVRHNAGREQV